MNRSIHMNTEKFIAEIKKRPVLWMSSHPQHKFRHTLANLWEEIQNLFPNCPDVRKKWKSLKDTYRKELKKIPQNTRADDFQVKWKYFRLLTFIKDEIIPTEIGSNAIVKEDYSYQDSSIENETALLDSIPATSEDDNLEQKDQILIDRSDPLTHLNQQIVQHSQSDGESLASSINASIPSSNTSAPSKKRRITSERRSAEYLERERKKLKAIKCELQELLKQTSSHFQTQNSSEDYHFLMSILPQMERLPPIQKMRLRNKINRAIIEEMEMDTYGGGDRYEYRKYEQHNSGSRCSETSQKQQQQ